MTCKCNGECYGCYKLEPRAPTLSVQVQQVAVDGKEPLALPDYATAGSSGMDLRANEYALIGPGTWRVVPTGICVSIPNGFEGQVRSRSGLAAKYGVFVLNAPGTVDSDYRGEIKVVLFNASPNVFKAERGERIAQLVFAPVTRVELEPVEALEDTERGDGGFGSTGSK
jgi:dUTP pyrophosphatase